MKTDWFYAENNEQKGPVSMDELKGLRAMGKITDATLAWHDGMTDWKPLAEALAADTAPASPPSTTQSSISATPERPRSPEAAYAAKYGGPAPAIAREPPAIGEATTSLVLGILSLVCFGLFTAIPGAIFGHIAIKKIKASNGTIGGKGLAIAGLVLSYVGFVFSLIVIAIYGFIFFTALAEQAAQRR